MDTDIFISKSELDTFNFAKDFAKKSKKGDIIVLTGELGSGKTKFTQGFLSFFNLGDEVSSPTFNIVNEYISENVNIYHFDIYRLHDSSEFLAIGGDEYFNTGICILEWGNIISDVLPPKYIEICFSRDSTHENTRVLEIRYYNQD